MVKGTADSVLKSRNRVAYPAQVVQIKETVGFQGLQKCGWSEPWERSDLGEQNPEPL
jgi:hypothetical protein